MPARTPEEASSLVWEACNKGNMEAALALYEPTAVLVHGDGTFETGISAIRRDFEGFFPLRATFRTEIVRSNTQGDIAFVSARWNAAWTGPDGIPVSLAGQSIEILRRQLDGTWLFAIHEGHASDWFGKG
jgi:uncharacterized protein (TIGR02246 family)